jgi:hypothetical protein
LNKVSFLRAEIRSRPKLRATETVVRDYAKDDDPHVMFMKSNGYPRGGEKGAQDRAWDKI